MLKIGKGLKKKKKSKKNKHKEEELFTEEELQQYKREHAQKPVEEETGTSTENTEGKPSVASEEFEKFKLLTAGVDDILNKTKGDLDRIKKESFFQRKPTPSELKAQEEAEKAAQKKLEGNWEGFEEDGTRKDGKEVDHLQVEFPEDSESEYEYEDDNDELFDTTYVDAIESGQIKLAHVPDDDELGLNDGPDPFDTTSADEILKKVEEEEKKKKKQISLGSAVHVLTGRAERDKSLLGETGVVLTTEVNGAPVNKARQRPRKIQDFSFLGSFDDNGNPAATPAAEETLKSEPLDTVSEKPKSLLDDDLNVDVDLPEGDVLITEVLVKQAAARTPVCEEKEGDPSEEKENLTDLVNQFDVLNEGEHVTDGPKVEEEDEFDEFTALAATSVLNQKLEEELHQFEDLEDDPFDTSVANVVLQEEPEKVDIFGSIEGDVPALENLELIPAADTKNWTAFDEKQAEPAKEVDPFDTTFVETIQPGKCELKLLENEILGDIKTAHKSDVHQEARILSRTNSDIDFNPREGEGINRKGIPASVHSKVSIQITDPSGFVETQRGSESETGESDLVSLSFSHRDLLGGSTTDLSKLGDEPIPLSAESPLEDFSKYSDPFDTSIVEQAAIPGKAELKFIEKEFLSDIPFVPTEILSDDDFDPRAEEKIIHKEVCFDIPSPAESDLLSSVREEGTRPLTPYHSELKGGESEPSDIEDPFDTSYVTSLPGKEELKLIEKELESVETSQPVYVPIHEKLGITEVQESDTTQPGIKHSLSDPDFNPRGEEENTTEQNTLAASSNIRRYSDITGLSEKPPINLHLQLSQSGKPDLLIVEEDISTKALTPAVEVDISSYIDPFDTSIAENIAPGKAELKVLENELVTDLTEAGGLKRSYTDPDFNPRHEVSETQPVSETNIQEKAQPSSDILSLPEETDVTAKPLTPVDFDDTIDDEIDPFDTSIAANLLPGKAEIRALESELFGQ